MHYAYVLKSSIDGEPFYVGKGSGDRMYKHIANTQCLPPHKKRSVHCKIQSILEKGGEILYERIQADSEQDAFDIEVRLIKEYGRKDLGLGPLCNLTDGGEGSRNANPESASKRAEKHRGMKRSAEARENMRQAQLKIAEQRHAETGYRRSPEAIAKQVAKSKGRLWSEKSKQATRRTPRARPVVCFKCDTGEFVGRWESIKECAVALNCNSSSIWNIVAKNTSKSCTGKPYCYKTHKGYTFEYAHLVGQKNVS